MFSPRRAFGSLPVRHKLTVILAVTVMPVLGLMVLYATTVRQIPSVEREVDRYFEVQVQTQEIVERMIDVQYGFRGFLLTRNEQFLDPFYDAVENLDPAIHSLKVLLKNNPESLGHVTAVEARIRSFLLIQHQLINHIRFGEIKPVRAYLESGQGQAALNQIRHDLKAFQESEKALRRIRQAQADYLEGLTGYALIGVIVAVVALWWLGSRLLAQTITGPLETLTKAAREFDSGKWIAAIPVASRDELGGLARTMEEMVARIAGHIYQMEVLHAVGNDVSMLGPDGLEGVLKRTAERAGSVMGVDLCLVLLWNQTIGCWKVGAASGAWHEKLCGTVLLREEAPVSHLAFTTREPQIVEDLAARPERVIHSRDYFGSKSQLAVPLRGPKEIFGVLAFAPTSEKRTFLPWEVRLAQQFADQAAIAIMNARLYEAAHQRGEGLQVRLQQLERYAADMAHDLKAPARRMAELASLLQMDYKGRWDERADRYLGWIRENGQQLMARIEEVLRLARLGTVPETIEPVDPAEVAGDVLKGCVEPIERQGVKVCLAEAFPKLACNRIHVFQVLDNLIRNAIKFASPDCPLVLEVGVSEKAGAAVLFVRDNGIGIPLSEHERIFQPFERLGTHEEPGTGLGLAIVKKIIDLYQGRVWVESEPGKGSTFFFTLPLYGELKQIGSAM